MEKFPLAPLSINFPVILLGYWMGRGYYAGHTTPDNHNLFGYTFPKLCPYQAWWWHAMKPRLSWIRL